MNLVAKDIKENELVYKHTVFVKKPESDYIQVRGHTQNAVFKTEMDDTLEENEIRMNPQQKEMMWITDIRPTVSVNYVDLEEDEIVYLKEVKVGVYIDFSPASFTVGLTQQIEKDIKKSLVGIPIYNNLKYSFKTGSDVPDLKGNRGRLQKMYVLFHDIEKEKDMHYMINKDTVFIK